MTNAFNVIVVGSGPAGASAAYRLARAGLSTLLLEKEKLPRYKPCGGGLTAKVLEIADFDLSHLFEDNISRLTMGYRSRPLFELKFAEPAAWCVMRDKFDQYLTDQAVGAGAVLHTSELVRSMLLEKDGARVQTAAGEYRADIVVGADGANGITARHAGLVHPFNMAAALEMEVAVSPAQLEHWRSAFYIDFGPIPFGYAWIFPKLDHLSIGIAGFASGDLFPDLLKHTGRRRPDLRALLQAWIDTEPTLRDARPLLTRGHRLPLGGRALPLHASRVILAGDAAGLIDPFTGEGIYYAMRSGQVAADVIVEAFRREDLELSEYTRRIHAEFLGDFRAAAGISKYFYRFPTANLRVIARSRRLQKAVKAMVLGTIGYSGPVWSAAKKFGRLVEAFSQPPA